MFPTSTAGFLSGHSQQDIANLLMPGLFNNLNSSLQKQCEEHNLTEIDNSQLSSPQLVINLINF